MPPATNAAAARAKLAEDIDKRVEGAYKLIRLRRADDLALRLLMALQKNLTQLSDRRMAFARIRDRNVSSALATYNKRIATVRNAHGKLARHVRNFGNNKRRSPSPPRTPNANRRSNSPVGRRRR